MNGGLHDELFQWIKEANLPMPSIPKEEKVWMREYKIGSKIAKIGSPQDNMRYNLHHVYQIIDCVCIVQESEAWILEFKKEPNFEAIGQVLVYKSIFEMEEPNYEKVNMGIVSNEGHPLCEIASIVSDLGITFFKRYQPDNWDDFIRRVLEQRTFDKTIEDMIKKYRNKEG